MTTTSPTPGSPIPLTTVFTPPASCAPTSFVSSVGYLAVYPDSVQFQGSTRKECFPSGYQGTSAFSPAPSLCPVGYSVACQTTIGEETSAICCLRFVVCAGSWVAVRRIICLEETNLRFIPAAGLAQTFLGQNWIQRRGHAENHQRSLSRTRVGMRPPSHPRPMYGLSSPPQP